MADKVEVDIELNLEGTAADGAGTVADGLERADKAAKALTKSLAKVGDELRQNSLLDEAFGAAPAGGQTAPDLTTRGGRKAAATASRNRTDEQRFEDEYRQRERRVAHEVSMGRREDPATVRARKEADKDAKDAERAARNTPAAKDARYLENIREGKRRNQMAIDAGLKDAPPTPPDEPGLIAAMTKRLAVIATFAKAVQIATAGIGIINKSDRDPFTTRENQQKGFLRSIGAGFAVDARESGSGFSTAMKEQMLAGKQREFAVHAEMEASRYQKDFAAEQGVRQAKAYREMRENPLTAAPGGPRDTVSGEQRFQYESRMEEPRDKAVMAGRAKFDADEKAQANDLQISSEKAKLDKIQEDHRNSIAVGEMLKKNNEGNGYSAQGSKAIEANLQRGVEFAKRTEESRAALAGYQKDKYVAGQAQADANKGVRDADIGVGRAALGDLRQREGVAGSQAARMTLLGPEGRLRAQQASDFVNQYGLENAPPEIAAAYMQANPEQGQKRAEREGGKHVEEFRRNGNDETRAEYRDDLSSVRKTGDDLAKALKDGRDKSDQELRDAILAVFGDAGSEVAKQIKEQGADAFRKFIAEGLEKSYSQPR